MSATSAQSAPQLEYLGFEVDHAGAVTVHVRAPGDMFGVALEQALRRIDEFNEPGRARILRALRHLYDVPVCDACFFRYGVCIPAQHQAGATGRARGLKKTNQQKEKA